MSSQEQEQEFSFKSLLFPFTKRKAIYWIIFIGLVVYANMLFNGFVWDDIDFIINNVSVHTINFSSLFSRNVINSGIYYRPLVVLYFSFLYSTFSNSSFIYHFSQLTLQIANSILLFVLFRRFFSKVLSFFLALLLLVHPMQVESISWIASVVNPLFLFFGLTALVASMKDMKKGLEIVVFSILLLLSLMAKETAILFFVLIVLFRLLFTRLRLATLFISEAIAFSMYAFLRFSIGGIYHQNALVPIAQLPLQQRLLAIPSIIYYYLKTFFIPVTFSIDQQWIVTRVDFPHFYYPLFIDLLFFVLFFGVGLFVFKHRRELKNLYLFFASWFVLGMALTLQIIPLEMTVSDRWFYFPMIGLVGVIGILCRIVAKLFKVQKNILIVLFLVVISLLSLRTIERNADWKDNFTLFLHDSKIQTNEQIENQLGIEYKNLGQYSESLKHFKKSSAMFACEENFYNIGFVYDKSNSYTDSKYYYLKAMNVPHCKYLDKTHQEALYIKLGRVLILTDNLKDAKKYIQEGIKEYAGSSDLFALLALTDYQTGDYNGSLSSSQKAFALSANTFTYSVLMHITKNTSFDLNGYLK